MGCEFLNKFMVQRRWWSGSKFVEGIRVYIKNIANIERLFYKLKGKIPIISMESFSLLSIF